MEIKNNSIGDLYKKSFENFEVDPSAEVWEKIEKSLGKKSFFKQYKLLLIAAAGMIISFSACWILKPIQYNDAVNDSILLSNNTERNHSTDPAGIVDTTDSQNIISAEKQTVDSRNEIIQNKKEQFVENSKKICVYQKSLAESKKDIKNDTFSDADHANNLIEKKIIAAENFVPDLMPVKHEAILDKNEFIHKELAKSETAVHAQTILNQNIPEDIIMPNAFSLSGAESSKFKPINVCENCHSFEMSIYSKSGELIYTTKDIKNGWNGTCKGQTVKADTYIYTFSYKNGDKNNIKRGYVVVVY